MIGLHYFGPNAGEVVQGYGLAFRFGATKQDFSRLIGIHPTCAEVFIVVVSFDHPKFLQLSFDILGG